MALSEAGTRVGTIAIRAQLTKRTTAQARPPETTPTASPLVATTSTVSPLVAAVKTSVVSPSVAARPIDRSRGSDSVAPSREIFESLSR